jgi:predicted permease
MTHCEVYQLKYRLLQSAQECDGAELLREGVDVVFRVSIPSSERTALLLQSTGMPPASTLYTINNTPTCIRTSIYRICVATLFGRSAVYA